MVAEGVEDSATAARLRALDRDEAQGYRFARPMTADELELFAADSSAWTPTAATELSAAR